MATISVRKKKPNPLIFDSPRWFEVLKQYVAY